MICAGVHGTVSEHYAERSGLGECETLRSCLLYNRCSQSHLSDTISLLDFRSIAQKAVICAESAARGACMAISCINILHPACGQYSGLCWLQVSMCINP